jgi:hypothetical protein
MFWKIAVPYPKSKMQIINNLIQFVTGKTISIIINVDLDILLQYFIIKAMAKKIKHKTAL